MTVFVDTSAFLAIMSSDDVNHAPAKRIWQNLLEHDEPLICTNYVLLEALTLLQQRLGMTAVRDFQDTVVPLLVVEWVDSSMHRAGAQALLTANRRQLSLVDCVSFGVMRQYALIQVFAFDDHFKEQGFAVLG